MKDNKAIIHDYTDRVTTYISGCEDNCTPSNTLLSHSNNKPLFTGELRARHSANEEAHRLSALPKTTQEQDQCPLWRGQDKATVRNVVSQTATVLQQQQLICKLNQFYSRFDSQRPLTAE